MSSSPFDASPSLLVPDLEILPARQADLARLSLLTARSFKSMIGEGEDHPEYCNLAAYAGGVPVGLLISRRDPDRAGRQDILSLMVTPLLRRQGVARTLLATLDERLRERGIRELAISWSDRLPQLESLIGLLAREGWGEPGPQRLRMSFNVRDAMDAMDQARRPIAAARGRGLTSRCLAALGTDGVERLSAAARALSGSGMLPEWADPDPWLARIDPGVTQVLCSAEGSIVGWLLAEHQPAFQRHAAPIGWAGGDPSAMLLAAHGWLTALDQRDGAGATLILQPSFRNGGRVASLLDRHFRPFALWADQLVISVRPVSDPDPS